MSVDKTSSENTVDNSGNSDPFAYLYSYQFALLKTYRKNGDAVGTPIWFANENGKLYITTDVKTGKVKRIKNNGRATLVPSNRMGKVVAGEKEVEGSARILPEADFKHANSLLQHKYKFMYRLLNVIESFSKRNSTYIEISPL